MVRGVVLLAERDEPEARRHELARRLEAGGHEGILGHGGEASAQNSDSWRTSLAGAGGGRARPLTGRGRATVRRGPAPPGPMHHAQPSGALDRTALALREPAVPRVELLVARDEVRPVRAEPVEVDLAHRAVEEQRLPADRRRARLGRQRDDPLDLLGRVVDPGQERRDQHAGRDARRVELRDRLEPGTRVRRVRLARAPRALVERRHGQARGDLGALGDLLEQVEVAQDQRRLRQDRARVGGVAQRRPDPAHELVAPLDPLVRVGVRPHRDVRARTTTAAPAPSAAPRAR